MERTLDQLKPGMEATVTRINTSQDLRSKLERFGLVSGTRVACRYRNPWGDVTALAFRGSVLALRTRDLAKIRVEL